MLLKLMYTRITWEARENADSGSADQWWGWGAGSNIVNLQQTSAADDDAPKERCYFEY